MQVKSLFGERTVTFGNPPDTEYVFKRNGAGDAVCEVENPEHLGRLLGIAEGYVLYTNTVESAESTIERAKKGKAKDAPPVAPEPPAPPVDPSAPLEPIKA